MLKLHFLTFIFIGSSALSAIAQDTTYYDLLWRSSSKDNAAYFRTAVKTNDGWQVADHYLSGRVQMTGSYADDSFHVKQGPFVFYDEKGIPNHRCGYLAGKLDGPDTTYYPNGHKQLVGRNKNDEMQGDWTGYYPNGRISGKVVYEKGKQVSGRFFHEDGSPNTTMTVFMREAEYPGGVPQFLRFLNKTLRYPDTAVNYEIQGTVVVSFKVSKEGKASEFKVIKAVDPSLDAEALRVLKMMPDWEPAITGGVYCDSYFKQPVVFHL